MVKTIIFDFGGVFIDLNKDATSIELGRLGSKEFSDAMITHNELYEKGMIGTSEFIAFYQDQFPSTKEQSLINAWNSVIIGMPEHRLRFIEKLRNLNRFQLILLSNTNPLHMEMMVERLGADRYNRFRNSFHYFYLSYELQMRKPEPQIFEHILDTHNLIPGECLFIDDTAIHTESASDLGIHTWNIDVEHEDISSLFEEKGYLFN
jgi:putative hydrolase of the HAD superfamily